MDTGWICFGLFIAGALSFIAHLIWVGIGRLFGFGKMPRSTFTQEADELRTQREIDALYHANLIDATTYQRVTQALRIARTRVRQQPPPIPSLAVMPPQVLAPPLEATPVVAPPSVKP
ncbi:MAG TPA: hypothetical protein VIM11_13810, partial [Tepidisphaeraceae bacterium]